MSRIHVITFVAASIVAVGCEQATEPIENRFCVAETYPGLEVEVRDAATGRPLAATATGTAKTTVGVVFHRTITDTLGEYRVDSEMTPVSLAGANREGKHLVEITHAGYNTWIAQDVQVVLGECTFVTVHLSAFLVRQ